MKKNINHFYSHFSLALKSYRPVAVYKESAVENRIDFWKKTVPYIKPYYAVKSFSHDNILNTLANNGVGFDVASRGEIEKVKNYYKPTILSHPIKPEDDILHAKENNIEYIVCDHVSELLKVKRLYPKAKIIWRIKSVEKYSLIKFNTKFGATLEETISALSWDFNIVGISFHVGSKCSNMIAFKETLSVVYKNIYPLFEKNGKKLEIIDIGGGFNSENDITVLNNEISEYINLDDSVKFVAEPGRFFSSVSLKLYTKVLAVKEDKDIMNIYINDSIYNTFSGKLFDNQEYKPHCLYDGIIKRCTIWGNTCDGNDVIVQNRLMNVPKVNDLILWDDVGAYTYDSCVNGFNGFEKPIIV
jgi:ornithine decarboxylase